MNDIDTPCAGPSPDIDTVAMISDALRSKFGDAAVGVATLQQQMADERSRAKWDEIVARLKA